MHAIVASDDVSITKRIKSMLQDRAWQCGDTVDISAAALEPVLSRLKPEMVVVVLPENAAATTDLGQVREQIKGKMVVVGPADSKLILKVLHQYGADEYVDIDDLEAELESVLQRSTHGSLGKFIAVMAPSGGGGSTTLAVNLATVYATKATSCALLDLNLTSGAAAVMLDLKPDHSLADFARNENRMDRSLFRQLLTVHSSGVEVLAAPIDYEDIPDVTQAGVRGAITMARQMFPYVVADLDQSCSAEQIEALRQAEVILMVFQLDFVSLHNLRRVLDYLTRSGIARSRVRLVANRYGQTEEIKPAQVEMALNMHIEFYLPEDPKDVHRAENTGVPVVIDRPRTKISRTINNLACELNGAT